MITTGALFNAKVDNRLLNPVTISSLRGAAFWLLTVMTTGFHRSVILVAILELATGARNFRFDPFPTLGPVHEHIDRI